MKDVDAEDGVCEVFTADSDRVRKVAGQMLPALVFEGLAETFQTLGDPTRVKILYALSQAELCVCDLAALLGLSVSAVSHQLRLLRSQRLVRPHRKGHRVYYSLDDDHVHTLFSQALDHLGHGLSEVDKGKAEASNGSKAFAAPHCAASR